MGEPSDFKTLLAHSRQAAGLSQNKAAAKARVSRKSWGWWERDITVPYKATEAAIENALGLEPGTLGESAERARDEHRRRRVARLSGDGAAVLSLLITLVAL